MLADLLSESYEPDLEETWELIEKWFHILKMRIDRCHNSGVGSWSSVREWLEQFMHYYNRHRPQQALDGKTPIKELQNYRSR